MSVFPKFVMAWVGKNYRTVVRNPIWVVLGAISAIIVAIPVAISVFQDASPSPISTRQSVPGRSEPSQQPLDGTALSSPHVNLGSCLSDAREVVPCDTAHTYEIFAPGPAPCSKHLLVSYLGGVASLDVLGNEVKSVAITLQGGTECALTSSTGKLMNATARDILTTSRGDIFRKCIDLRKEIEVPCSEPHTSEVVYDAESSSGAEVNCPSKAAQYIDKDPASFASDLKVILVEVNGMPECQVTVLGHNVLTASIRNLGTQALPISAIL
jgi:hypothetical protein